MSILGEFTNIAPRLNSTEFNEFHIFRKNIQLNYHLAENNEISFVKNDPWLMV